MEQKLPRFVIKNLRGFHGYLVSNRFFSGDYLKFLQNFAENSEKYVEYAPGFRKHVEKLAAKNVHSQKFNSGLQKLQHKLAKQKKKAKTQAPKISKAEQQRLTRLANYQKFTEGQPLVVSGCTASRVKCDGFTSRDNEYLDNATK